MTGTNRNGGKQVLVHRAKGEAAERIIYTRWDRILHRRVVVKQYVARSAALQEARVMRRYGRNPYLVTYYRFFTRGRKGHIVMEWVKGESLSKLIVKYGPLPPRQVAKVGLAILAGVEVLHRAGYVHGDLHGRNVIVSDLHKPHLKIIDFQHAVRRTRTSKARARRKLSHPPLKLAPETRKGVIDNRYDVYGVGFMMASMLIGKEPTKHLDHIKEQRGRTIAERQL